MYTQIHTLRSDSDFGLLIKVSVLRLFSPWLSKLDAFISFIAGKEYITYNGDTKFFLSDEPDRRSVTYLDGDCVIELDLTKSNSNMYRSGNG